jgi:hypothetical protein
VLLSTGVGVGLTTFGWKVNGYWPGGSVCAITWVGVPVGSTSGRESVTPEAYQTSWEFDGLLGSACTLYSRTRWSVPTWPGTTSPPEPATPARLAIESPSVIV